MKEHQNVFSMRPSSRVSSCGTKVLDTSAAILDYFSSLVDLESRKLITLNECESLDDNLFYLHLHQSASRAILQSTSDSILFLVHNSPCLSHRLHGVACEYGFGDGTIDTGSGAPPKMAHRSASFSSHPWSLLYASDDVLISLILFRWFRGMCI